MRVFFRPQELFQDGIGIHLIHDLNQSHNLKAFFVPGFRIAVPKDFHPGRHGGEHFGMCKLCQMNKGGLPCSHKGQKFRSIQNRHVKPQGFLKVGRMYCVECLQYFQDVVFLVAANVFSFRHEFFNGGVFKETQKVLSIGKSPRYPYKLNVTAPEAGEKLNSDSNVDPHDPGCLQDFNRKSGLQVVVIDHP